MWILSSDSYRQIQGIVSGKKVGARRHKMGRVRLTYGDCAVDVLNGARELESGHVDARDVQLALRNDFVVFDV